MDTGATAPGDSISSKGNADVVDIAAEISGARLNSMSGIDGEYSAARGMVMGERSGTGGGGPAISVPHLGRPA